ncbi:hypothetical protein M0R45_016021 [Rubus argutus]|uniref:Uncharacterized protein n=1 Tax=Rubus argutus TaxID=59490 RepID=A0AAW1XRF5_RUBAR
MSHSWFINFDKFFKSEFPIWFLGWWAAHGMSFSPLPEPLQKSIEFSAQTQIFTPYQSQFPAILHFTAKYKVPWILKWHYNIISRNFAVKWWDKFKHDIIISQVNEEFRSNTSQSPFIRHPHSQLAIQTLNPQTALVTQSPTSSHSSKSKEKTKASLSKSAKLKELANQLLEEAAHLSNDEDEERNASSSSSALSGHTPPSEKKKWVDYPEETPGEYFQYSQNPCSPY